jgi:DNA processing protein
MIYSFFVLLFNRDNHTPDPAPPAASVPPAADLASLMEGLSETQRLILQHMDDDPAGVDLIHERTELPAPAILGDLTLLSLRGLVRRVEGQTYVRR